MELGLILDWPGMPSFASSFNTDPINPIKTHCKLESYCVDISASDLILLKADLVASTVLSPFTSEQICTMISKFMRY